MKKYLIVACMMATALVFYNCHSSKKATSSVPVVKLNYETNLQTVVAANCSPCHFPAKGGNKEAFDTYAKVKVNIDHMIQRIELNPADKGFMPFKHPKLSDSTIAVFKQWRADGLLEK